MVDLETIDREINELENRRDTTYAVCERLAWLYVVRDHLSADRAGVLPRLGGSEFLDACGGVPLPDLMRVLNEHMEALYVVMPKEYAAVMGKIRALR